MDGTSNALLGLGEVCAMFLMGLGGATLLLTAWYGLQCASRVWDAVARERREQEAVDAALDKVDGR